MSGFLLRLQSIFYFFIYLVPLSGFSSGKITFFQLNRFFVTEQKALQKVLANEKRHAQKTVTIAKILPFMDDTALDSRSEFLPDVVLFSKEHWQANIEQLSIYAAAKGIPLLVSNMLDCKQALFPEKPRFFVYEINGVKIGLFSLLSPGNSTKIQGLQTAYRDPLLVEPILAAKMVVEKMQKKGCSYIVLVSDLSIEQDLALVQSVADIDLIIGSHSLEPAIFYEKDTLIYKSSSLDSSLDRVDIVIEDQRLLGMDYHVFHPHFRRIAVPMKN